MFVRCLSGDPFSGGFDQLSGGAEGMRGQGVRVGAELRAARGALEKTNQPEEVPERGCPATGRQVKGPEHEPQPCNEHGDVAREGRFSALLE